MSLFDTALDDLLEPLDASSDVSISLPLLFHDEDWAPDAEIENGDDMADLASAAMDAAEALDETITATAPVEPPTPMATTTTTDNTTTAIAQSPPPPPTRVPSSPFKSIPPSAVSTPRLPPALLALDDIARPNDKDVLFGRGGGAAKHVGNVTFRNLITLNRGLYAGCTVRLDKLRIAESILRTIRSDGGRFLEWSAPRKMWYDVGDKRALQKTQQALREGQALIKQKLVEARRLGVSSAATASASVSGVPTMKTKIPTLLTNIEDAQRPRNTTEALLKSMRNQARRVSASLVRDDDDDDDDERDSQGEITVPLSPPTAPISTSDDAAVIVPSS